MLTLLYFYINHIMYSGNMDDKKLNKIGVAVTIISAFSGLLWAIFTTISLIFAKDIPWINALGFIIPIATLVVSLNAINALIRIKSRFFPNRDRSFNALTRIAKEADERSTVMIAMYSGLNSQASGAIDNLSKVPNVKVIVTDPISHYLDYLNLPDNVEDITKQKTQPVAIDHQQITKTRAAIKSFTRLAIAKNWDIRWFNGDIQNTVIISNHNKNNAWAKLDVLIPNVKTEKRPMLLVYKEDNDEDNRELYDSIYKGWEFLWNNSSPPRAIDYQT
jgi:hypothetical protein